MARVTKGYDLDYTWRAALRASKITHRAKPTVMNRRTDDK